VGDIEIEDMFSVIDDLQFVDALKDAGYDSVKLVEPKNRGVSIAVFDTKKIKALIFFSLAAFAFTRSGAPGNR